MTQPHDDGLPVEHDPTGMRALLAGLPDPGPMPDELVSRITAALAAEADAGQAPAGARPNGTEPPASPRPAGEGGAHVVPLRRRSSRLRHLGVAAAVMAVVGLGTYGVAVMQGGGVGSLDAVAGRGDSGSDTPSGSMERSGDDSAEGQSGPGPAVRVAPAPGSGEVVVVMSGTNYTEEGLEVSARSVADADLAPLADLSAEAPTIGPIGTPVGARSCADALGIPGSAGLLVDLAELDGRPAAVIVALESSGRTAYVVERSCTTGTTGPISGPVTLE